MRRCVNGSVPPKWQGRWPPSSLPMVTSNPCCRVRPTRCISAAAKTCSSGACNRTSCRRTAAATCPTACCRCCSIRPHPKASHRRKRRRSGVRRCSPNGWLETSRPGRPHSTASARCRSRAVPMSRCALTPGRAMPAGCSRVPASTSAPGATRPAAGRPKATRCWHAAASTSIRLCAGSVEKGGWRTSRRPASGRSRRPGCSTRSPKLAVCGWCWRHRHCSPVAGGRPGWMIVSKAHRPIVRACD